MRVTSTTGSVKMVSSRHVANPAMVDPLIMATHLSPVLMRVIPLIASLFSGVSGKRPKDTAYNSTSSTRYSFNTRWLQMASLTARAMLANSHSSSIGRPSSSLRTANNLLPLYPLNIYIFSSLRASCPLFLGVNKKGCKNKILIHSIA